MIPLNNKFCNPTANQLADENCNKPVVVDGHQQQQTLPGESRCSCLQQSPTAANCCSGGSVRCVGQTASSCDYTMCTGGCGYCTGCTTANTGCSYNTVQFSTAVQQQGGGGVSEDKVDLVYSLQHQ